MMPCRRPRVTATTRPGCAAWAASRIPRRVPLCALDADRGTLLAKNLAAEAGEDLAELERGLRHVGALEQGAGAGVAVPVGLPERQVPDVVGVREVDHVAGVALRERPLVVVLAEHRRHAEHPERLGLAPADRQSTRLNSSHPSISYAVFCLKK